MSLNKRQYRDVARNLGIKVSSSPREIRDAIREAAPYQELQGRAKASGFRANQSLEELYYLTSTGKASQIERVNSLTIDAIKEAFPGAKGGSAETLARSARRKVRARRRKPKRPPGDRGGRQGGVIGDYVGDIPERCPPESETYDLPGAPLQGGSVRAAGITVKDAVMAALERLNRPGLAAAGFPTVSSALVNGRVIELPYSVWEDNCVEQYIIGQLNGAELSTIVEIDILELLDLPRT